MATGDLSIEINSHLEGRWAGPSGVHDWSRLNARGQIANDVSKQQCFWPFSSQDSVPFSTL